MKIMRRDLKKNSFKSFERKAKSPHFKKLKVHILNEVALNIQVVRKRVTFQDRKNPCIKI